MSDNYLNYLHCVFVFFQFDSALVQLLKIEKSLHYNNITETKICLRKQLGTTEASVKALMILHVTILKYNSFIQVYTLIQHGYFFTELESVYIISEYIRTSFELIASNGC